MMLQLQQYNFNVIYKRGKELHIADTLSRASSEETDSVMLESEMVFRVEFAMMNLKPDMMSEETFKRVRLRNIKRPNIEALVGNGSEGLATR